MTEPNAKLQAFLQSVLGEERELTVLEAGCGSASHISLGSNVTLVGIDISEGQLRRNTHLHEKIVGDIQTHRWPAPRFDAAVCWDVLEHLPRPCDALEALLSAVKPGGVLVLAFPNLYSLKGLVTKFTPYAVHVWFYRMMGDASPDDEFGQFPTYFRTSIVPGRVCEFGRRRGCRVAYFDLYEGPVQKELRRRSWFIDKAFALLGATSRALTCRRQDANLTDCMLVLQRPDEAKAAP